MTLLSQFTLDQLQLFVTVAEGGSFSEAARRLDRVQSSVSHSVAQLERHLGVLLFDRSSRKPQLTDAGQILLKQAYQILSQSHQMQQQAQILQKGHEPHLSVVLDMIAPLHWISQSLIAVQNQYPDTTWQVHTEMLDAIAQRVLKRSAQLGITGWLHPSQQRLLASEPLGKVAFVYVVAPQHALARLKPPVPRVELNAYIHLNVTDRSADNPHLPEAKQWQMADLSTLVHFIKAGFGWGFLPLHLVKGDLEQGSLGSLELDSHPPSFELKLIYLKTEPPGPVGLALAQRLKQEALRHL